MRSALEQGRGLDAMPTPASKLLKRWQQLQSVSSIASVTPYATVHAAVVPDWNVQPCTRASGAGLPLMPGLAYTCACAAVRAAEVLGSPPDDTHIRCTGCGAAAVGLRRCSRCRQVQYCR
jgi:hypothetical protein